MVQHGHMALQIVIASKLVLLLTPQSTQFAAQAALYVLKAYDGCGHAPWAPFGWSCGLNENLMLVNPAAAMASGFTPSLSSLSCGGHSEDISSIGRVKLRLCFNGRFEQASVGRHSVMG